MNRNYTKTTTFLFPLLGIPKKAYFFPTIVVEKVVKSKLLINAYLQIKNETTLAEGVIYLLLDGSEPNLVHPLLDLTKKTATSTYHKTKGPFHVVAAHIQPEFAQDYQRILMGQYSKISDPAKKEIRLARLFDGYSSRLNRILRKDPVLKKAWEERLNAHLGSQEVWPILELKNETLDLETLGTKEPSLWATNFQFKLDFEAQEPQKLIEQEL